MYDRLFDLVKDNLNLRIHEPGNTDLLKKIIGSLTGMSASIQIDSRSQNFNCSQTVFIEQAKYIGRVILLETEQGKIKFSVHGIIVTVYDDNIMITAPGEEEVGSKLIININNDFNNTKNQGNKYHAL